MSRRLIICMLALILVGLFLVSCTVPNLPTLPAKVDTGDKEISEVKLFYRSSNLIVAGKSVRKHTVTDQDGKESNCTDIIISRVLAGNETLGGIIHVPDIDIKQYNEYLFFLESVDGNFRLLTEKPLQVVDGRVIWTNGTLIALNELQDEFDELANIVVAPSVNYFFDDIYDLMDYVDDIFYATVTSTGKLNNKTIRLERRGLSIESNPTAAQVELYIDDVVKGSVLPGTAVELLYLYDKEPALVNHATMKQIDSIVTDVTYLISGERYVFFTLKSSDEKQNELFMVNPYQGAIRISERGLSPNVANTAIYRVYERNEDLILLFADYMMNNK